ncbi:hypothetical protein MYX78_05295 [Acidobacteria bacterium AH-259-G07]|nr:hypothetical protein [Acidobacteria bacterium AH-259-G07]
MVHVGVDLHKRVSQIAVLTTAASAVPSDARTGAAISAADPLASGRASVSESLLAAFHYYFKSR